MFEYISEKRRGMLFLYKDELNGWPLSTIVTTSPKQYLILELEKDLVLPFPGDTVPEVTTLKKAKGVRRGIIQDVLTSADFFRVGVHAQPSRSVTQYAFKKHMFSIFLNKSSRVLLSRGNSKRIFFADFRTDESFFSLPLFVRHLPDIT